MQQTKRKKIPLEDCSGKKINTRLGSKGDIIRRAVDAEKEHGFSHSRMED